MLGSTGGERRNAFAALERIMQSESITDPELYKHDRGKIARLMELPEGTRVPAPKIAACDGLLGFEDGRHRALVAKLQGLKAIPVLVRADNVAEVRQLLSKFSGKRRP
jgi:hypothetical protein